MCCQFPSAKILFFNTDAAKYESNKSNNSELHYKSRWWTAEKEKERENHFTSKGLRSLDWYFPEALIQMLCVKTFSSMKAAFNLVYQVPALRHRNNVQPITEVPNHFHFYRRWKTAEIWKRHLRANSLQRGRVITATFTSRTCFFCLKVVCLLATTNGGLAG